MGAGSDRWSHPAGYLGVWGFVIYNKNQSSPAYSSMLGYGLMVVWGVGRQTREVRGCEGALLLCDRAHKNAVVCALGIMSVLCGIQ